MTYKDVLYVIDLDRTLVDVEKVMAVTEKVCKELGVDFEKIYKDQQDLSQRGTAYSPFEYIADYPNVDINQFKSRFIELSKGDEILFADSRKFIEKLVIRGVDQMILTHGVEDEWQILKIRAASLTDIPYVIVRDRYKSRLINSWLREDGRLEPGVEGLGVYKRCVFIDDRPVAFVDFPAKSDGYLLNRKEILSQEVDLPPNVKIIKSLSQVA